MSKPAAQLGEVELQKLRRTANGATTPPVGEPPRRAYVAPGRVTKTPLTAFFEKPVKKQLRKIGLEHDKTLQTLLREAVNDLFAKYGQPEIAE
jgi:hypothetical protein